ncbi:MAG: SAM-dependent methyltransferase, partial [Acidimicrobiia bacterium]|nr:SAM-dependent methyltransferase [Acidimicrobiia bacterium]
MLRDVLIKQIAADGPMPFEVFQQAALYHPEFGFYAHGPVRSTRGGDFVTSPEVSSLFGQTVSRFVSSEMARCGVGAVAELGAGSGSLLGPLMETLTDGVRIIAVEHSTAATEALAALAGVEVLAELPDLVDGGAVVVGNEVVDNVPVALTMRTADGWLERLVGTGGDGLEFVLAEPREPVRRWADRYGAGLPVGAMLEVQLEASKWFGGVLDRVGRGAIALFDYGGLTEELETRRLSGTLRTYRNH